jgi:hypothetical protein
MHFLSWKKEKERKEKKRKNMNQIGPTTTTFLSLPLISEETHFFDTLTQKSYANLAGYTTHNTPTFPKNNNKNSVFSLFFFFFGLITNGVPSKVLILR